MQYVYLLQSMNFPDQNYIGMTDDLKERLKDHNANKAKHTSKFKLWKLISSFAFSNKKSAIDFERYLKTVAGWAFAKKRLW